MYGHITFIFNRSNCIHWQIRNIYFSSAPCNLSIISIIKGEISMNANNLTLEQKIGQMLIAGFPSTEVDDHFNYIVEKLHIGNIILFARNIKAEKQLHELNVSIHKKVLETNGVPPFITIDQEGGMVTRIDKGVTFFPGNMALTASNIEKAAFNYGRYSARELKALGINLNLAPVLDVNNNPANPIIGVRSYSDNPDTAGKQGADYVEGLQGEGVAAVGKHFPGHGDTDVDSHLALPLVPHQMKRLEEVELVPFKAAIKQGVQGIMTAHVLFPAIEEEKMPATLSHKVITGLLRETLGFEGLVFTDCLEMNAIKDFYGVGKAAVAAIKAGADILLVCHTRSLQEEAVQTIKTAVENGEISLERINDSVNRILNAKAKYAESTTENFEAIVGCEEHKNYARFISQSSITLVHNNLNLVPLKSKNILTISPRAGALNVADDALGTLNFAPTASECLGGDFITIEINPEKKQIEDILKTVNNYEVIILATYNSHLNKGQEELLDKVLQAKKEVIHVALRNPYDITHSKEAGAALCSYEYTEQSVESIVNVLKGTAIAAGKLPINLETK